MSNKKKERKYSLEKLTHYRKLNIIACIGKGTSSRNYMENEKRSSMLYVCIEIQSVEWNLSGMHWQMADTTIDLIPKLLHLLFRK